MTTGTHVQYRPAAGAWWLAADGAAFAMLAPDVPAATAAAVWARLGDGGIGAVLDALTAVFGTSLTALPSFALAVAETGGVRVAARGAVEVVVESLDGAPGAETVSGEGVATWAERFVAGAARVSILPSEVGLVGADEASVPLRSGVVSADLARIGLDGSGPGDIDPVAAALPAPPHVVAGVPDLAEDPAGSGVSATPEAAEAADAGRPDRTDADVDAVVSADTLLPEATEVTPVLESIPTAVSAPDAPSTAPTTAPTPAGPSSPSAPALDIDPYDLLWGETIARPASPASPASAESAVPGFPVAPGVPAASAPEAPPVLTEVPAPAGPVAPASAADPGASGGVADLLGDHDGATISVAEARALRGGERGGERSDERPSAPGSGDGERFDSIDDVPPRRPAQGRIVLSTGRVVELDRPVVIGRRPRSTRASGAELPTLVAVDSPDQDISRSHVEIRAEGEHVLVVDLDTTNGTILLRAGQDPVRLHPGEPTMVITGDVLDLGEGVTVAFEELP